MHIETRPRCRPWPLAPRTHPFASFRCAKYHVGVVVDSVGVVGRYVGVFCIDGEGCRSNGGGGGGRRYRSSGALPLGGLLWKWLHLGRHGGVVVIVEGSVVGGSGVDVVGGVGVGVAGIALFAVTLFIVGDFLV